MNPLTAIFCEAKRKEEWARVPSWRRWKVRNAGTNTALGRTYAQGGICLYCGKPVRTVT